MTSKTAVLISTVGMVAFAVAVVSAAGPAPAPDQAQACPRMAAATNVCPAPPAVAPEQVKAAPVPPPERPAMRRGQGQGQGRGMYPNVTPPLTEDQKKKIEGLQAEARKKVADTQDMSARGAIMQELHKTVMETVLTPEQRASMPKRPEGGRRPRAHGNDAPPAPQE